MGKISLQDKVLILLSWALVLMCSAAERDYFPQMTNSTWDQARSHCQVCFKELVTLTPQNIQNLSQNLTSDYWVGLRKNLYNTSNHSMSWSRWANGDPLIFQNWYPGSPVFKSSPKSYCCSCSCTKPAMTTPGKTSFTTFTAFTTSDVTNMTAMSSFTNSNQTATDFTTLWNSATQNTPSTATPTNVSNQTATDFTTLWNSATQNTPPTATATMPVEAECVKSPILSLCVSETDVNYIEDSCVAMLSFGAWVEKNCSELLPFICYEDRFLGQANMTSSTSESAFLTWLPGPGNISHYRIEVKVDEKPFLTQNLTNLTYELVNLTAGTGYSVQVFPVKCERDLNPQKITFYTKPNQVESISFTNVTETSVFLMWNKPAGNRGFYLVKFQGGESQSAKESTEVKSLIPGTLYTFTVHSEVNGTLSEGYSISLYTKPGKVFELKVSDNTQTSLLLSWSPPNGNFTGFLGKATYGKNEKVFEVDQTHLQMTVTGLPICTEITLSVTALTNGTLKGEEKTVVSYTAPGPVSNLVLDPNYSSLTAKWTSSECNSSTIVLSLNNQTVATGNSTVFTWHFDGLKTAANYTVEVYALSGYLKSQPVRSSIFTKPLQPTNAIVSYCDKKQITIQWTPPVNISPTARYSLRSNSSFWGQSWSYSTDKTKYTFAGLKSGTKYDFEVRTEADKEQSEPACVSHSTDAEKREISLSMLCSSTEPLHCDNSTTRDAVFKQLNASFNTLFGGNVFWKLEKQETK